MGRVKRTVLVAAIVLAALALVYRPAPAPLQTVVVSPSPSRPPRRPVREALATPAVVYVAGAVRNPGLYRLAPGARADDAVRAAGGMAAHADAAAINLAARVADGDEVRVPLLGEPTGRSGKRASKRSKTATPHVVDVNRASADELASVPGIGATLAARIVALRDADGAYATLDELLDVAGMSAHRLERATPYLRI